MMTLNIRATLATSAWSALSIEKLARFALVVCHGRWMLPSVPERLGPA
jgi:hypothetical protein